MARPDANFQPDSSSHRDRLEPVPDSAPLRVSVNTDFESGIPPARTRSVLPPGPGREPTLEQGVERTDSALASAGQVEANLSLLGRGLKHLAAGAFAARAANLELQHELEELRNELQLSHEDEHALRFRMGQLEQLLEALGDESARERKFLIEQQDRFLLQILNDHERQLRDLQRRSEVGSVGGDLAQQLAELTLQRDQARQYAIRCQRERDLAWQELARDAASVPPDTIRR